MYKKERYFACPHNDGVMCTCKNCIECGWHPTTAKIRLDKIRKEMGGKND